MKAVKIVIAALISFVSCFNLVFAEQKKGNIGFGFGVSFMQHQESQFKQSGFNYFRLDFKAEDDTTFFLHNEIGTFSVEDGANLTDAVQRSQGIGASTNLGVINMDIIIGSSTVKTTQFGTAAAANSISGVANTDPFAEIGVRYSHISGNASLDTSFGYRYHNMSNAVEIRGIDPADPKRINNLSSMNLSIAVSYNF
ncbi:MAG: hypothetical protein HOE30_26500 [Deltaproteobacteria bacterium]|nr:hypothetical protein [Deltaproteobacteria bacterium]MBT4092054.1 hypothetical protein [Deltaproteobacteria bacterium]MBT4269540.1 hypothetical protein [Deltaproteobacteria bacterium]MBT4642617.1 hypothetical protein [Deltaproteobacteria bacterium]MBT7151630.1 hypothetical protein [Deltaproteobacteria bacterium]